MNAKIVIKRVVNDDEIIPTMHSCSFEEVYDYDLVVCWKPLILDMRNRRFSPT